LTNIQLKCFQVLWKKVSEKKLETAEILFLRFYYYHWVDTSAGGLLVPEGIIHPIVGVSALTWLIKYMETYSLIHVIINTTKVLLFQPYVTLADFGYSV